jgi:hypothetical protein
MTKFTIELKPTPSSSGIIPASRRRMRMLIIPRKKLLKNPRRKNAYNGAETGTTIHPNKLAVNANPAAMISGRDPNRSLKNLQKLPENTTAKPTPMV